MTTKTKFHITVKFDVMAADLHMARGIANGAYFHLVDTYNDDNSMIFSALPTTTPEATFEEEDQ